jgi:hypothetical protein
MRCKLPICKVCGVRVTTYGWQPFPFMCHEHMEEARRRLNKLIDESVPKIVDAMKVEYDRQPK